MRGRVGLGVLGLQLGFALACGSGGDDDEPSERFLGPSGTELLPIDIRVEPPFQVADVGETVTADVFLTWPTGDGRMPELQSFDFVFTGDLGDGCRRSGRWVDEGVHWQWQLTVDPVDHVCRSDAEVRVGAATVNDAVRTPGAFVHSLPTRVELVALPDERVVLGLGEVRPWTAMPLSSVTTQSGNQLRAPARAEVTWSSDDASVATVDERGVITASGLGETVLTASAGGVSASATVQVLDLPLGPPAVGHHQVTAWDGRAFEPANQSTVDGQGQPVFVLATPEAGRSDGYRTPSTRPVLLTWTGTGFGFETLGGPSEATRMAWPATGVDGDYLLVYDRVTRTVQVHDRDHDEVTGGWSRRDVPFSVDVYGAPVASAGIQVDIGKSGALRVGDVHGVGIPDRTSDGVIFAWASPTEGDGRCRSTLQIGRFTRDTSEVATVLHADVDAPSAGGCEDVLGSYLFDAIDLAWGTFDAPWPVVDHRFLWTPDGWTELEGGIDLGGTLLQPTTEELAAVGHLDGQGVPVEGFVDLEPLLPPHPGRAEHDGELEPTEVVGSVDTWAGASLLAGERGDLVSGPLHLFQFPLLARPAPWRSLEDGWIPPRDGQAVALGPDGTLYLHSNTLGLIRLDGDRVTQMLLNANRPPGRRPWIWTSADGPRLIPFTADVVERPGAEPIDLTGRIQSWSVSPHGDLWAIVYTPGDPQDTRLVALPRDATVPVASPADPTAAVVARPDGGALLITRVGPDAVHTFLDADGAVERTQVSPPRPSDVPIDLRIDGHDRIGGFGDHGGGPVLWVSDDDGSSWAPRPLPTPALADPWFETLPDGRFAVAGVAPRAGHPDWPTVWASDDGGLTWSEPTYLGQDADPPVFVGDLDDLAPLTDGAWLSLGEGALVRTAPR